MELFIFFAFIFGTLLGSFLNVVILRHNTGRGITGRSGCFSCGKTLSWYELIPVVSFLIQRGRCRGCGTKISIQYPLVEFCSGVVVALFFLPYIPSLGQSFSVGASVSTFVAIILSLYILLTYLAILVYDARHFIIPDSFVWGSVGAGILFQLSAHYELVSLGVMLPKDAFVALGLIVAGALFLALPFASLWVISKGMWVGLGDAKLIFSLGIFLGLEAGIDMFLGAIWSGALIGLLLLGYDALRARILHLPRAVSRKTALPFGPFLILSGYAVFFFGMSPLSWFGLANLFG